MPPSPVRLIPTPTFWIAVAERLPANKGHARNFSPHGPFVGTVGEVAFEHWFRDVRPERVIRHIGDVSHDYEIVARHSGDESHGGMTSVEVKTKLRTRFDVAEISGRWLVWEASVPDYLVRHLESTGVHPDVIVATSVQSSARNPTSPDEITDIVIVGWMPYREFLSQRTWIPEGTRMGSGRSSHEDMWNVFIKDLRDLTEL